MCSTFPTSSKTVLFNGTSAPISIAQLLVQGGGGGFDDSFNLQIAVITENCNKLTTFNLSFNVPPNSKLNGTFDIKDFFDAGTGDCFGSILEQNVSPISQNLFTLSSGKVIVIDKGNKLYNLNVTTVPLGQSTFTLSGDVQF